MIGSTPTVPISIALVAGGLAVINPCGFPLLPAFLSYYLGADERRRPAAPTGVLQGQLVGGLVTVGFLGFFALVGLPVSYGVAAIARAVPGLGSRPARLSPSLGCSRCSAGSSGSRRT